MYLLSGGILCCARLSNCYVRLHNDHTDIVELVIYDENNDVKVNKHKLKMIIISYNYNFDSSFNGKINLIFKNYPII